MKISVCIPTYKRPDLLKEAIESVLMQDTPAYEILIGDDSPSDECKTLVESYQHTQPVIRYWHHAPGLGQAANVQHLIQQARGDLISLLHDDDRFRTGAFTQLLKPHLDHPEISASFGKQTVIREDGSEDSKTTREINEIYFRGRGQHGLIQASYEAGLTSMFPNNCYFVKRKYAQRIDYHADGIASKACDYYFGLRLGKLGKPFWFCNEFTADYRMTAVSSARSGSDSGFYAFKIATEYLGELAPSPKLRESLQRRVKVAILQGISISPTQAWKWYFSKWHRPAILTAGGARRFICLLLRKA